MSGAAALLLAAAPEASAAEVAAALGQSAVPVDGVTFGRVDVARALELVAPAPAAASASAAEVKRVDAAGRFAKRPRAFRIDAAAGLLRAVLTSRSSRRIRHSLRSGGRTIATRSGRGKAVLQRRVRAGRYRVLVSGPAGLPFRITLTYRSRGNAGPA